MPFMHGIFFALSVAATILLSLLVWLLMTLVHCKCASLIRRARLQKSAAQHAETFEKDILESHFRQIRDEVNRNEHAAREDILKRFAAADDRFLDAMLQMTMRMLETVKLTTVQKDVETQSDWFLFKTGRNADLKQIRIAGMPVGRMFAVEKRSTIQLQINEAVELIARLRSGGGIVDVAGQLTEGHSLAENGESK